MSLLLGFWWLKLAFKKRIKSSIFFYTIGILAVLTPLVLSILFGKKYGYTENLVNDQGRTWVSQTQNVFEYQQYAFSGILNQFYVSRPEPLGWLDNNHVVYKTGFWRYVYDLSTNKRFFYWGNSVLYTHECIDSNETDCNRGVDSPLHKFASPDGTKLFYDLTFRGSGDNAYPTLLYVDELKPKDSKHRLLP